MTGSRLRSFWGYRWTGRLRIIGKDEETDATNAVTTALATRRYGFVWETTILGADTFVAVTQALGTLPALLGFNVPTVEMIRISNDTNLYDNELVRQAWAVWLVPPVLVTVVPTVKYP